MVATIEMIRNLWIRKALTAPSRMPSAAGDQQTAHPAAAAHPAEQDGRDILHDGRRDREGDVDTAGDQHDEQADGEDDVDGTGVEQIERVAEREEAVGDDRQEQADDRDDRKQRKFRRVGLNNFTHRRQPRCPEARSRAA